MVAPGCIGSSSAEARPSAGTEWPLMRRDGLQAKSRRRFKATTDSRHTHPVAPDLLHREFNPEGPNRVWASDITYIWTLEGWLYLAVIIDLYSRGIVGWSMAERLTSPLVRDALQMALQQQRPPAGLLHHSDRGSQYAAGDYQELLTKNGILCSMSRRGNCWDNAPVESFFSTLKREWVFMFRFPNLLHLKTPNLINLLLSYQNIKMYQEFSFPFRLLLSFHHISDKENRKNQDNDPETPSIAHSPSPTITHHATTLTAVHLGKYMGRKQYKY